MNKAILGRIIIVIIVIFLLLLILGIALFLTSYLEGSTDTFLEWTWKPGPSMNIVFETNRGTAIFFALCFLQIFILLVITKLFFPSKNWNLERS